MPDLDENGFVILEPVDCATAIVECGLCDDDGYRGALVCDHREHASAETREAAKARLREALGKGGAS